MRGETTRPGCEPARGGPHACRLRAALVAAAVVAVCPTTVCPAAAPSLDAPITATWRGIGLRAWAAGVDAGVVVDRRLDPDALLSLECREEPLRDVVGRAAALVGGEAVELGATVRIVPPGVGELLQRAERGRDARVAKLPAAQKKLLATRHPWAWPDGAVPGELVAAMAAAAGVVIEGIETVPHDHLAAASLPSLSLAERFDLVLAHYDRRIEWRAGGGGLPTGRIVALATDLPAPTAAAKKSPPAGTRPGSSRRDADAKPAAAAPRGPRETYSLQVAAPLEKVLDVIATRLGLSLDLDRESLRRRGVAAGEIVKATVKNASRDQLLDAILAPLELTWTVESGTLRVFAKPSDASPAGD